jgi:hypothetical protein
MKPRVIHHSELPKAALRKMSASQRSYIDEFTFILPGNGTIAAYYAGDYLASWNGKSWRQPLTRAAMPLTHATMRGTKATTKKRTTPKRDPEATQHFTVSKTYEVVTPESAEEGDVEDRGFEYEKTRMSLRDLIREIKDLGSFEFDSSPMTITEIVRRGNAGASLTLYTMDTHTNYQTGAETSYALHIKGSPRAMKRLGEILISQKRLRRG